MQNKQVKITDLGLIDYQEAWDYQEKVFAETVAVKLSNRKNDEEKPTPNHVLICQHPHVYTLGKSGKEENLLLDEAALAEKEVNFYKINRGGDITYHGPGQLVIYPILDLENFFTDIHKFLRLLEEAVILTLAEYGIEAGRVDGYTGVWLEANKERFLGERKICAMGVKASRWVTMHGLALNVNTDLAYFGNIVACGIQDKAVTSMQMELGKELDLNEVAVVLVEKLSELFEMELV
ncbi:lipoyl(octanoyl) transferase LipB [Arcticibacterium luteifluviistationis]|uniref:Octanoyltransferase n=1 Tax=Arcticibacterium luteifluviistationis TaxID=1784714 RepID=A0A2Z4GFQ7_9BACT|nr:lipoyl(octanoyl) transferase LipB [Arcticibacterium luteifluviistationis]AWV99818.1 lipoyl(octanoyl) transferase [Arcticibacterium luteifluviistationis]